MFKFYNYTGRVKIGKFQTEFQATGFYFNANLHLYH